MAGTRRPTALSLLPPVALFACSRLVSCTGQHYSEEQRLRLANVHVYQSLILDKQVPAQRPGQVRQVRVDSPEIVNGEPQLPMPEVFHRNLVRRVREVA